MSLNKQSITSVAEDAFTSSRGLQRLSLSENVLFLLPKKLFAPLDSLQLLDLGGLGFATGGVRHVHGLVKLENLVPQPKPIEGGARRLAAPHASPGEILAGGHII